MSGEGGVGRDLLVKKNNTVFLGLTSATIDWNGEPIDVTSGENSGVRCLLAAVGSQSIDISCEGITKDNIIKDIALNIGTSKQLTDIEIEWPIFEAGNSQPATLTGNFNLVSRGESAPMNEAITFSFSLQSSGDFTYTPEAV